MTVGLTPFLVLGGFATLRETSSSLCEAAYNRCTAHRQPSPAAINASPMTHTARLTQNARNRQANSPTAATTRG